MQPEQVDRALAVVLYEGIVERLAVLRRRRGRHLQSKDLAECLVAQHLTDVCLGYRDLRNREAVTFEDHRVAVHRLVGTETA